MRKNVVRVVTAGTDSSDDQSPPKKAIPMNRLRIVFQNVVFSNRTKLGDRGPFLVTGTAESRNISHIGFGIGIRRGKDIVFTVAGHAAGGQISTSVQGFAVQTLLKLFDGLRMAKIALYLGQWLIIQEMLSSGIHVTRDASEIAVDRLVKAPLVDPQRNRLTIFLCSESAVAVAGKALLIVLRTYEYGIEREDTEGQQEGSNRSNPPNLPLRRSNCFRHHSPAAILVSRVYQRKGYHESMSEGCKRQRSVRRTTAAGMSVEI
jgi:hypothetical protein